MSVENPDFVHAVANVYTEGATVAKVQGFSEVRFISDGRWDLLLTQPLAPSERLVLASITLVGTEEPTANGIISEFLNTEDEPANFIRIYTTGDDSVASNFPFSVVVYRLPTGVGSLPFITP